MDDSAFPVRPRPPRSHYWPKRERLHRAKDLQVRAIAHQVIRAAPFLDDAKYHPLIVSFARVTLLIEKAYAAIAHTDLISAETGELRTSLGTLSTLIAQQTRMAAALGLSPAMIGKVTQPKPVDLAAAFAAEAETTGDDDDDPE